MLVFSYDDKKAVPVCFDLEIDKLVRLSLRHTLCCLCHDIASLNNHVIVTYPVKNFANFISYISKYSTAIEKKNKLFYAVDL